MKKPKPLNRKRPGVLVRFYPSDLAALNKHCADACTPRENFLRRVVLDQLALHDAERTLTRHPQAVVELHPGTGLAGGVAVTIPRRRRPIDNPKKKR